MGLGAFYTIIRIRIPRNSIGNFLGPYSRGFRGFKVEERPARFPRPWTRPTT